MEQAFTALYARYAHLHHGPRYDHVHDRISSTVLVPSHIFDDTTVWVTEPDSLTRQFELREHVTGAGVTDQQIMAAAPWPEQLGDARHIVRLRKLGDGDYSWDTDVVFAFGTISAADVADGIVGLLTSADTRRDSVVRDDYRTAFPHTTEIASRLFALDSLLVRPASDGSRLVTLQFSLHPDRLRPEYPQFADYMHKYVGPTHYDLHLSSHSGAEYLSARSDGPPVILKARLLGEDFLPLAGGMRPLPDSLVLWGSFTTKVGFFTVGVHHFSADFVISRSAHERSWTLHFGEEPDWELPLAVGHFISGPLSRPFQGRGMSYSVAVRDTAGAQTILSRRAHAEVHQSAIMRFIGGLISRVLLDQDGAVEEQEYDYFGRAFDAIRTDYSNLLPPR